LLLGHDCRPHTGQRLGDISIHRSIERGQNTDVVDGTALLFPHRKAHDLSMAQFCSAEAAMAEPAETAEAAMAKVQTSDCRKAEQ